MKREKAAVVKPRVCAWCVETEPAVDIMVYRAVTDVEDSSKDPYVEIYSTSVR